MEKLSFKGTITSIQPRIRLLRSFDEFSHTYLGYAITLEGELENSPHNNEKDTTTFSIGIGKAAHGKHQFKVNDMITGECLPVENPELEPTQFYKVSKLKILSQGTVFNTGSPWELVPPELEVYRERGHRRLAARTYQAKCSSCMWGCRMSVEIIIDNWNPKAKRKYRIETFCYGPLSCKLYKAGPNRKVEGRNGVIYVEEDWLDVQMTEHREEDE